MNTLKQNFSRLRAAALVVLVAGAAGAEGMMLYVGGRNPSWVLRILFTGWVLGPFVCFLLADAMSKRWPALIRETLHILILCVAAASMAIYGRVAFGPPMPQQAFAFLTVPLASWLIAAVSLSIAALISRSRS
jgi:hypothetical protein